MSTEIKLAQEYAREMSAQVRSNEYAPVMEAGEGCEHVTVLCQTERGGWLPLAIIELTDSQRMKAYKRPLRFMLAAAEYNQDVRDT